MLEWLRASDWSGELWIAVWCAGLVLVGIVSAFYGNHLKR
jgi:hypothetical protein